MTEGDEQNPLKWNSNLGDILCIAKTYFCIHSNPQYFLAQQMRQNRAKCP
jgi:hypothetical protein